MRPRGLPQVKMFLGVRMVNQLDIDGLFTPGTVVVDYLGKRIVGQSIVPGIFKQREPEENQIDYGAVDGKDVVASDERFVPVFDKLSKSLRVKKHAVWDKDGKRHELEGSIETKGLLGTDSRKYVLDLYRITPLDIIWMEECGTAIHSPEQTNGASRSSYPHRMTVLRPELVDAYWKTKLREWANAELVLRRQARDNDSEKVTKEIEDKPATSAPQRATDEVSEDKSGDQKEESLILGASDAVDTPRIDAKDFEFALNPDAFSGQEPQTEAEKEEWAKDEKEVRLAGEYLRTTVLPDLVNNLKEGEVGIPMDGQSLSRLLHKRGINIRYLGQIAELAQGKKLESLLILATQEMVSRAFKHVAGKYLRYLPIPLTTSCIAHLLNCFLGTGLNSAPKANIDETLLTLYPEADLTFQHVSPESLKHEIESQIFRRYRYKIDDDWVSNIKPLQLLRETSLKLGLQVGDERVSLHKPALERIDGASTCSECSCTEGKWRRRP